MTLQAVRLDDLNWRAMVDAIRGRIAAASHEEWTLHAPVDPGVTLLELFAYLLEQRLYWMDQVPDALIQSLIGLLGAQRQPATAATTLLELISPAPPSPAPPFVDAGAVFRIRDGDAIVRVSAQDGIAVLPVERIDVAGRFGASSTRSQPAPRWAFQPLTILPADRTEAEVQITLWLRQAPGPEHAGKSLALFFDLDVPAKVPSSWSTSAVEDVATPAEIAWSYSSGSGQRRPVAAADMEDKTQGLRRSGVVRLPIPAQWAPAQPAVDGLTPYRLWLRTEDASFSAPPRLNRLVPNVAAGDHAVAVETPEAELKQLDQWMPLPGLVLQLSDKSPPLEDSISLRLLGRDQVWRDWTPTWDFSRHGPSDPVMLVDRAFNCLRFGDGLTGRLPVLDRAASIKAELHYLAGGGEAGNLGSGLEWVCADPEVAAVNPVAVRGGGETETAIEARDRVAAALLEVHRAVTAPDHEDLAKGTPGVAVQRAKAVPGFHPGFPCVSVPGAITVFIVPDVPRIEGWLATDRAVKAPQPDPGMLAQVRGRLEDRRLVATELFVLGPAYRDVEVVATLAAGPLDKAAVAERLRTGLTLYLDPLVGGNEGAGWPFGQPVRPSELAHQLQRLAGEDAAVERVAVRLANPAKPEASFEDCVDVAIAPHELVVLRSLGVKWKPRSDQQGGLR
ncbi:putative baseplate assembly protein [Mesorhizobium muleiense]|uniref:putative baseplate assembly protein n=1 Tax=Mesorhizobium muleiense TaxID=1004279 RepID=UPI003AFA7E7C